MSVSSLFDQSEYINNLLNDLKIEKSLRFEPGELAIDIPSDKFYMICDQLIYNINKHHNSTNMVVGSSSASNRSIYSIDQVCHL